MLSSSALIVWGTDWNPPQDSSRFDAVTPAAPDVVEAGWQQPAISGVTGRFEGREVRERWDDALLCSCGSKGLSWLDRWKGPLDA